jgi:hypothetical protein
MTAGELAPGQWFRQPATGLVATVVHQGSAGTAVRVEGRSQVVAVGGHEFVRPAAVVTWSSATEAEVTP